MGSTPMTVLGRLSAIELKGTRGTHGRIMRGGLHGGHAQWEGLCEGERVMNFVMAAAQCKGVGSGGGRSERGAPKPRFLEAPKPHVPTNWQRGKEAFEATRRTPYIPCHLRLRFYVVGHGPGGFLLSLRCAKSGSY